MAMGETVSSQQPPMQALVVAEGRLAYVQNRVRPGRGRTRR